MIRKCKTIASQRNEKDIQSKISAYDSFLKLRFSSNHGYYYITRKALRPFSEESVKEMLEAKETIFAQALANREFVVCWPITVDLMEHRDACLRSIMKHLKLNDSYKISGDRETRIRHLENENDAYWDDYDSNRMKNGIDEIGAYGREFYRHRVAPHEYVK